MSKKTVTNVGASVRAKLLNLSKERKQTFQLVLTNYVLERLLYRLSQTKHRDRFVLKGAMLLTKWFDDPLRPTRDLDLLGVGDDDPDHMVATFREVCAASCDDGVNFDVDGVSVDLIREELEYGGLRIKTSATVDGAKVKVVIVACTRFRRHRVWCFDGTGGGSWRGGSFQESSSLRRSG